MICFGRKKLTCPADLEIECGIKEAATGDLSLLLLPIGPME
jgi:hypothetical protein